MHYKHLFDIRLFQNQLFIFKQIPILFFYYTSNRFKYQPDISQE